MHDDVEQILRRATLRSALQTLTPRERELIALKFHGGLSNVDSRACSASASPTPERSYIERSRS